MSKEYTFDPWKISGHENAIANQIIKELNSDRLKRLLTLKERQYSLIKQLQDKGFTDSKVHEIYTNTEIEPRDKHLEKGSL